MKRVIHFYQSSLCQGSGLLAHHHKVPTSSTSPDGKGLPLEQQGRGPLNFVSRAVCRWQKPINGLDRDGERHGRFRRIYRKGWFIGDVVIQKVPQRAGVGLGVGRTVLTKGCEDCHLSNHNVKPQLSSLWAEGWESDLLGFATFQSAAGEAGVCRWRGRAWVFRQL